MKGLGLGQCSKAVGLGPDGVESLEPFLGATGSQESALGAPCGAQAGPKSGQFWVGAGGRVF